MSTPAARKRIRQMRATCFTTFLGFGAFLAMGAATLGAMHQPDSDKGRVVTVWEGERTGDLKPGDTLRIQMEMTPNGKARCDHYGGVLVRIDGAIYCDDADF